MEGFDSVRLKIARAREHQEAFDRETIAFFSHVPERAVAKFDEDEKVWVLELLTETPSEWSCIVGDCLQNLRQALDHFVWACAAARGKASRQISFPIAKDRDAWQLFMESGKPEGKTAKTLRKSVGAAPWAFVQGLQPHMRNWNDRHWDPDIDELWILNDLARVDRHQALHLAIVDEGGFGVYFGDEIPQLGNVTPWEQMGLPVEPNTPLFRTRAAKNHPSMEELRQRRALSQGHSRDPVYCHIPFTIRLDPKLGAVRGISVRRIMLYLCDWFEGLVPEMETAYAATAATS